MRNAINGTWLYGVVLVFMMIFIAYISISFNYSRVYQMKSVLTTSIEQNQGVNPKSMQSMATVIAYYGYKNGGICPEKYVGISFADIDEPKINRECGQKGVVSSVCVRRITVNSTKTTKYYYRVGAFFGFDLPGLGNIYTFFVDGETNEIYYPSDDYRIESEACL